LSHSEQRPSVPAVGVAVSRSDVSVTGSRMADVAVGQEADEAWFLGRVPGGPTIRVSYITRWEGQDESGNRQTWVKGHNVWKRIA